MKNIFAKIGFVALSMLVTLFFSLLQVEAATFKVKCNKGKTIQKAVDKAKPGDVIEVTGLCEENLVIPEEVHSITLDGQGTATIDGGPANTTSTVTINGTGITIRGFTVTGGRNGIVVSRGAAIIEGTTVQNTGNIGIFLTNRGFARILDSMSKNNPSSGVAVSNGSTARIGFTGTRDARIPRPNTITENDDGVVVSKKSFADMGFNTISGNTFRGVRVSRGSAARLGGLGSTDPSGNLIQNNGREGIQVQGSSNVEVRGNTITNNVGAGIELLNSSAVIRLDAGGPDAADNTPNTISNNGNDGIAIMSASAFRISNNVINGNGINGIFIAGVSQANVFNNVIDGNAQDGISLSENSGLNLAGNSGVNGAMADFFGLRCSIGAYATGTINNLTGTSGKATFDGTCIENLSDFP